MEGDKGGQGMRRSISKAVWEQGKGVTLQLELGGICVCVQTEWEKSERLYLGEVPTAHKKQ